MGGTGAKPGKNVRSSFMDDSFSKRRWGIAMAARFSLVQHG